MTGISTRGLYLLGALSAMLLGGVVAQVLIETLRGQPTDVSPVLAAMAGSTVTALFSGHFFSSQAATLADMRDTFGQAISAVSSTASSAVVAAMSSPASPLSTPAAPPPTTSSGSPGSSTGGPSAASLPPPVPIPTSLPTSSDAPPSGAGTP